MYYSSIGILSLLILLIINYDVMIKSFGKKLDSAHKSYRFFLYSVMVYYIIDAMWGLLVHLKLRTLAYIDTTAYFIIICCSVFFWTQYVIRYLNTKGRFIFFIQLAGWFFLISQILTMIVNLFVPIVFYFTDDCIYKTAIFRYVNMSLQFVLFIFTSAWMFFDTTKTRGKLRRRHLTIALFGLSMTIFVALQELFPLMPFYAIGYMLGTCVLHTFVVEDEKESRKEELEALLRIEEIQEAELGSARQMAYTDPLTNVKNKNAYIEDICGIERRIEDQVLKEFGLVVFDVNGLKVVNDTLGHEAGDNHIREAAKIICRHFKQSPVYRIGGDEFVVFLIGDDFKNRETIFSEFEEHIQDNIKNGKVAVSCGFAQFNKDEDESYVSIFERADKKMYENKKVLKEQQSS